MTTRERMEARAERRREWAAGRASKAAAIHQSNEKFRGDYAFNTQPGHIPERARVIARTERAFEHSNMAAHHTSKAGGIEAQLDRSIFSDDPDAIEALEEKAADLDSKADRRKAINAAFRKATGSDRAEKVIQLIRAGLITQDEGKHVAQSFSLCHWQTQPFAAYELTNLRANARRLRERIKEVERRKVADAATEEAGGLLITRGETYCSVRFSEKPSREVLEALRAAFFNYSGGAWSGPLDRLPACVAKMEGQP
jgi:PAS domain-containing protein